MTIGLTQSRQRTSVAVASGHDPVEDHRDDKNKNGAAPVENKYKKKRRRKTRNSSTTTIATQPQQQLLGLLICCATIFFLARFVAIHRVDSSESHYARAQAILQDLRDANARHQNRRYDNDSDSNRQALEQEFATQRSSHNNSNKRMLIKLLDQWMAAVDLEIRQNVHGGIRWIRPYLLPPLQQHQNDQDNTIRVGRNNKQDNDYYRVRRPLTERMAWQDEYNALMQQHGGTLPGPTVDYTNPDKYTYPPLQEAPPPRGYPQMTPLGDLMKAWDQDADNTGTIAETLLHFDFTNPDQLKMAERFRDAMVPFKLVNVPELVAAGQKWTDDYVAQGFAFSHNGQCQESPNHFFAFFTKPKWDEKHMGLPPSRNNDWDYARWAAHARYADAAPLAADQPHYYWQAGVTPEERFEPVEDWSFISKDLPSWSATEQNFIMFHLESQKGIQCRFGERGVVAATHYDNGRNMVAMITGAKRYILSPPNACGKLGIFSDKQTAIYRHSLLNFGHMKHLDNDELSEAMSPQERAWLERAATAPAVETVLKAGEVLYIPSHWFHYIISVQKSAQCNARSGVEKEQHLEFGGMQDVTECTVTDE